MLRLRRVNGVSMMPTLKNGQLVITLKTARIRPGHIIIARQAGHEVIKRVKLVKNGRIYIEGDNKPQSVDSREYGPISSTEVYGRVIWLHTLGN